MVLDVKCNLQFIRQQLAGDHSQANPSGKDLSGKFCFTPSFFVYEIDISFSPPFLFCHYILLIFLFLLSRVMILGIAVHSSNTCHKYYIYDQVIYIGEQ